MAREYNKKKLTDKEMTDLWLKTNKPSTQIKHNQPFPHLVSHMYIKDNSWLVIPQNLE